jgi:16S rRNA (cytidine1402-2'-O)-methyltransferase
VTISHPSLATLLQQAAAAATARQHHPGGALYVVATPIGNLADLTLRAVAVLAGADCVGAEDTRVAAQLLRHLGLDPPRRPALLALHAHNEDAAAQQVLARLAAGEVVAFVSDAGTPAVSDPGARLVAAAAAAGYRVVPVPGASAVLAALSVAGDPALARATAGVAVAHAAADAAGPAGADDAAGDEPGAQAVGGFVFVGFLPARGGARRAALAAVAAEARTQVLFEAPHRIADLAGELAAACGAERHITVARELTKQFETVATMPLAGLPAWLAADENRRRGEFVLVLHALPQAQAEAADPPAAVPAVAMHALRVLMAALPLKQAVALAAQISGAPRNALYTQALRERDAARAATEDDRES